MSSGWAWRSSRGHVGRNLRLGPQAGTLCHPKTVLLIDDHQAQPMKNHGFGSKTAWVPTSRWTVPASSPSRMGLRSAFLTEPGQELDPDGQVSEHFSGTQPRCCWAKISVGAMMQAWTSVVDGQRAP